MIVWLFHCDGIAGRRPIYELNPPPALEHPAESALSFRRNDFNNFSVIARRHRPALLTRQNLFVSFAGRERAGGTAHPTYSDTSGSESNEAVCSRAR